MRTKPVAAGLGSGLALATLGAIAFSGKAILAKLMYRHGVDASDKILYTTGRLTSEMVIKTVKMRIPVLVSRSGFTAWGVELAQKANLTLIGRARGRRFVALAGLDRLVFDADPKAGEEEDRRHVRKGSLTDAGD